jgi:hypothetical protein
MTGVENDLEIDLPRPCEGYLDSDERFGFFVIRDDQWGVPRKLVRQLPETTSLDATRSIVLGRCDDN